MASVMGICGGLVGPESENVEKPLVFKGFLKDQGRGSAEGGSRRGRGAVEARSRSDRWISAAGRI